MQPRDVCLLGVHLLLQAADGGLRLGQAALSTAAVPEGLCSLRVGLLHLPLQLSRTLLCCCKLRGLELQAALQSGHTRLSAGQPCCLCRSPAQLGR